MLALMNELHPGGVRMVRSVRSVVLALGVLAGAAHVGAALAQVPAKVSEGVLTNGTGMTLYFFDRDTPGKSACNGPCANSWPPFAAGADAKPSADWTVITREDGSKQWAYKGKPLYTWAKDQKPGEKTGDNFNNVWHVATP